MYDHLCANKSNPFEFFSLMFIDRNCTGGVYKSKPNLKYTRETKVLCAILCFYHYFVLQVVYDCWRYVGANGKGKSHTMAIDIQESADQEPSKPTVDSTGALKSESRVGNISSQEDNVTRNAAAKTRQKLFWGYAPLVHFYLSVFNVHNLTTGKGR